MAFGKCTPRSINIFDALWTCEADFGWRNAYHRPVFFVEMVDCDSSIAVEFMIYDPPLRQCRKFRTGDFGERGEDETIDYETREPGDSNCRDEGDDVPRGRGECTVDIQREIFHHVHIDVRERSHGEVFL